MDAPKNALWNPTHLFCENSKSPELQAFSLQLALPQTNSWPPINSSWKMKCPLEMAPLESVVFFFFVCVCACSIASEGLHARMPDPKHKIWSNYSATSHDRLAPKCSFLEGKWDPLFQGNPGW